MTPPPGDIAHTGHAQLFTVHLRTFDDYEHHRLVLTAREQPGLGRLALRTSGEEALHRRIKARSRSPAAPAAGSRTNPAWASSTSPPTRTATSPALKNQPQAKPNRGMGVRRLDHVNFLAADVLANAEFQQNVLGARPTEQIWLDSGKIAARWLTYTNKSYDVVHTSDRTGSAGRLHHIAFATDTREDILRAADLAIDSGVFIETGPHKHAIQQTFFRYVHEPGGNRIELCNPLTRLVLAPDWPLITWTEDARKKDRPGG